MIASDFQPGEKVTFTRHGEITEHGIVKSTNRNYVFVVYKCAGNWEQYEDYTAAPTEPNDLTKGWNFGWLSAGAREARMTVTIHIPNSIDDPLCGATHTRHDPVSTDPEFGNVTCLSCLMADEKRRHTRRVKKTLSGIKPWTQ